jgi:hypothetical protein
MSTKELIQRITDLAVKNYRENIHPDPFASIAAHIIAAAAAAKFSPEAADTSAFIAISSMIDLSRYSLQQANLAIDMHDAMKNYNSRDGALANTKLIVPAFIELVAKEGNRSFGLDGSDAYDLTFDSRASNTYRLALHAACAIYNHAYACSRAAYTHAVAVAAIKPMGETRNEAFKTAITARLSTDLLNDPIEASFLIKILCSDVMKTIGIILLVAGLAALTLGICGLAMAPVGAAVIATIGVSSVSLTTTGAITAAATGGLFAGRFFAAKKQQSDKDITIQAVNTINNIEHAAQSAVV